MFVIFPGLHLLVTAARVPQPPSRSCKRHTAGMPGAHDANAAYSEPRNDAKASGPSAAAPGDSRSLDYIRRKLP
jgi:hypothetical protein